MEPTKADERPYAPYDPQFIEQAAEFCYQALHSSMSEREHRVYIAWGEMGDKQQHEIKMTVVSAMEAEGRNEAFNRYNFIGAMIRAFYGGWKAGYRNRKEEFTVV